MPTTPKVEEPVSMRPVVYGPQLPDKYPSAGTTAPQTPRPPTYIGNNTGIDSSGNLVSMPPPSTPFTEATGIGGSGGGGSSGGGGGGRHGGGGGGGGRGGNQPYGPQPVTPQPTIDIPSQEELRSITDISQRFPLFIRKKEDVKDITQDRFSYTTTTTEPELTSIEVFEEYRNVVREPPKKVYFNADPNFVPPDKESIVVYTDKEGRLTGKTSDPAYDVTAAAGKFVDRDELRKFIRTTPILETEIYQPFTKTIVTKSSTNSPYAFTEYKTRETSYGTGTRTELYQPVPSGGADGSIEFIRKIPNVLPTVAEKVTFSLVDTEKPSKVTVDDKRYYSRGTSVYNPITQQYELPKPQFGELSSLQYEAKTDPRPFSVFAGGVARFGQYAIPYLGEGLMATEAVVGISDMGEGTKQKKPELLAQGALAVLPLGIYKGFRGGIKAKNFFTKETTTVKEFTKGKDTIGQGIGIFKEGELRANIRTTTEAPDVFIETTTPFRRFFNLPPKVGKAYWVVDKGERVITLAKVPQEGVGFSNIFTKKFGDKVNVLRGQSSSSKAQQITLEELNKQPGAIRKVSRDFFERYGVKIESVEEGAESRFKYFVFQQNTRKGAILPFVKERLLSVNLKSGRINFVSDVRPPTVKQVPKTYGIARIEQLPTPTTALEGTQVFRVLSASKETRSLTPLGKSKTQFSEVVLTIKPSPTETAEAGFSFIKGSGSKTAFVFEQKAEQIVKAAISPPATKFPSIKVNTVPVESTEGIPLIVGGTKGSFSWYTSKGGVESNVDYNVGKLGIKPQETFVVKPIEKNIQTLSIRESEVSKGLQFETQKVPFKESERFNLGFRDRVTQRQEITPRQEVAQITSSGLKSKLRELLKIKQETQTKTRTITPRINIPKFRLPKIPKRGKLPPISSELKSAYDLVIYNRGKEQLIAKGLPKGKALKLGVKSVISNLRASFKIKPRGTTAEEDIFYELPKTFAPSKVEKNRFVQRLNTRFGTRSETKEAQFFRKQTKGRIKWF